VFYRPSREASDSQSNLCPMSPGPTRSRKQTGIAFARLVAKRLGKRRHIFYRYQLRSGTEALAPECVFLPNPTEIPAPLCVYGRKWELSCEHLIKDDTRRIDVTGGCFVVMESFRRHVQERASALTMRSCGSIFFARPKSATLTHKSEASPVKRMFCGFTSR